MGKLHIVRHAQASLFSRNYDNLSTIGIRQSELLGAYFQSIDYRPDKIFLGPHQRHSQTLHCASTNWNLMGTEIVISDTLNEHEGPKVVNELIGSEQCSDPLLTNYRKKLEKQNLSHEDHIRVYQHITQKWVLGEIISEGETWTEYLSRIRYTVDGIIGEAKTTENIFLISSTGPCSVFVGEILNLNPLEVMQLSWRIFNTGIFTIEFKEDNAEVKADNFVPHISSKELLTLV
jgi:broad specificity phosphatase PhoE